MNGGGDLNVEADTSSSSRAAGLEVLKSCVRTIREYADEDVEQRRDAAAGLSRLNLMRRRLARLLSQADVDDEGVGHADAGLQQQQQVIDAPDGPSRVDCRRVVRDLADRMLTLLDSPLGVRAVDAVADNWDEVFTVVCRFALLLAPAAMFFVVSSVVCERQRSVAAAPAVERFVDDIWTNRYQVRELQASVAKICRMLDEVWVKIEQIRSVDNTARWLPAETSSINDQLQDISDEIEIARTHFKTAEKLLKDADSSVNLYRQKLIAFDVVFMAGAAAAAGALYHGDYISWRNAVSFGVIGCAPLCHTLLDLSGDISTMLNEIHRRELHNSRLETELKKCEHRLKQMERRRQRATPD